jgi:hypothetical protein
MQINREMETIMGIVKKIIIISLKGLTYIAWYYLKLNTWILKKIGDD